MKTTHQWLSDTLVNDSIDWQEIAPIDPLTLRSFVTLHDSSQIKVVIDSAWDGNIVIAVRWDTFWNKDILDYPGDNSADWPYLLIRIDGVSEIRISDFMPIGGTQRAVSDSESEKIDEGYRTRLMDVSGGKIDFLHSGPFRAAAFFPLIC